MDTVIVLPRLHPHHAFGEIDQIRQGPCHGTENAGYAFLAWHARVHAHFRPSSCSTAEGVDAGEVSGCADGTGDVGANANPTASKG